MPLDSLGRRSAARKLFAGTDDVVPSGSSQNMIQEAWIVSEHDPGSLDPSHGCFSAKHNSDAHAAHSARTRSALSARTHAHAAQYIKV